MRLPVALLVLAVTPLPAQAPPPAAPAAVAVQGNRVELRYGGAIVFNGAVTSTGAPARRRELVDSAGGKITQIVSWAAGAGRVTLQGTVHGTRDAFAVDADPPEDALPIVRNSVGPSYSRLNRAVYARSGDWLLSVDFPASVRITPVAGGDSSAFTLEATGGEVTLRFRPRYYQQHRGLAFYQPWTYTPWQHSVAGWTSWFAFRDQVTEADVHAAASAIADRLAPFGFQYVQIDDGFQQLPIGVPDHWLHTNAKFPGGLTGLVADITARGLTPGLWTNVSFADSAWAAANARYFVRTPDGKPVRGNWVGWVMDGANPATMQDLVLPVYRELKRQGWGYFKVDALRHLRYEGYNSHADFYAGQGLDRVAVYRGFVQQIRDAIGRESFLLASWGPRPELVGIIDATRLGDDGFGYGGFAQFNSFNNVVWRNDPDHIEISRADGYRAATLTSLTGSLLMLTDRPDVYRTERVEAARRAAPVLFTLPGQVYDIDPTRSDRLFMANSEVSGSGPRPFEADQRLQQTLYQLDIARPFERWTVLARTPGAPRVISMADLGLDPAQEYLAFDFWRHEPAGAFRDSLVAGPIDTTYKVQLLCLRPRQPHPQLLATDRHVSCGGVDLEAMRWEGDSLAGRSHVVPNEDYTLYLTEPAGWALDRVEAAGARVIVGPLRDHWRALTLRGARDTEQAWVVRYRRTG